MKLVIDIPEDTYIRIKDNPHAFDSDICKAIRNGIPCEENPQTIGCFSCKHDYKRITEEPCKYCKHTVFSRWETKEGAE